MHLRRRHRGRLRHAGAGHRLQPGTAAAARLFAPDADELPDGVHAFRTMDDCLALSRGRTRGHARGRRSAAGCSVSPRPARWPQRGAQVVLAQQGERLMERQLDDGRVGSCCARHLEELGVEVHTECRVRGVRSVGGGGPRGRARRRLRRSTPTSSCSPAGCAPASGSRRPPVWRCASGIVVDDELRTSDPHIHAIGDCAEHAGVVYGLAGPAQEQADVLAESCCTARGEAPPPRYTGTRALTRLTLAGRAAATRSISPRSASRRPAPGRRRHPAHRRHPGHVPQGRRPRRPARRRGTRSAISRTVGALARAWEGDEPLPSDAPLLHLLTNDGGS